jgi:predicted RNase H-like HicB family nuclease
MARYVAIVDGTPGAYGVVVPDLPGCTSGGATIDEALRNAVEAVTLWVEDARADGEKIPKPRPAEKLRSDPDVATAIDEAAERRGLTRSAFLASAAREKIESEG